MANSIGAYQADGASDIGAYEAASAVVDSGGSDLLRRKREMHIRRQAARRVGARERWFGMRRTRRMY